jgi:hypothetical protein
VRVYDGNRGFIVGSSSVDKIVISNYDQIRDDQNLNSSVTSEDAQSSIFNQLGTKLQQPVKKPNWSYLEQWPANYNYSFSEDSINKQQIDLAQLLDYTVTFNWYKDISNSRFGGHETSIQANSYVIGIIGIKDTVNANNHQIKIKYLVSNKVYEVHDK